jgi:HSP90 family molecular chaperone
MSGVDTITKREFTITVLGRTLEHLGIQMYKRRDAAIAELVANSWDAEAKKVEILVPEQAEYDPATSAIFVTDDGSGMEPDDIQDHYLVIGRNARKDATRLVGSRPIMGRKGIGKLAGFGLASRMLVVSWRDDVCTELEIDVSALKKEDGVAATVPLEGTVGEKPNFSDSLNGTRIVLRDANLMNS